MSNINDQKRQIVIACQKLWQRGLVANHDGNISLKLGQNLILATPTSFSKADIKDTDLLQIDNSGKVIEGDHKVFSEISWHLAIYKVRPDIKCVVHAHPPVASGFGLSGYEIGIPALPEAIVSLGSPILNTSFISPLDSSTTFEIEFGRALAQTDACIVPGNGVWAVGQTVEQAYLRLELVEQIAKQHLTAFTLGALNRLSSELVSELLMKRQKPGTREVNTVSNRPKFEVPPLDLTELKAIVRGELENIINLDS